jgi:hypothetical protein
VKVKRQSKVLRLTRDYLVVNCAQQRVSQCRKCERQTVIVITSESHELRWCSHCASQLLMTTFDGTGVNPTRSWRDIKKWVDNGSVQLIETPETTFIITFDTYRKLSRSVS